VSALELPSRQHDESQTVGVACRYHPVIQSGAACRHERDIRPACFCERDEFTGRLQSRMHTMAYREKFSDDPIFDA
jgi:hypothetical protein